jgi:DNA-binding winged helix-turn-helix (wHTH) protein
MSQSHTAIHIPRDVRGEVLTITDLPASGRRWTPNRRANVVLAVTQGVITEGQALERYRLTHEEFASWTGRFSANGVKGLIFARRRHNDYVPIPAITSEPAEAAEPESETKELSFGVFSLDIKKRTCKVGENPLHLTDLEYRVLEYLLVRRDTIISREMLLKHLYGSDVCCWANSGLVDVIVCKLRKKLGTASEWVETIWGRGYILHEPKRRTPPA